jgi:lambda repressor-like predicted transcriptional regulator
MELMAYLEKSGITIYGLSKKSGVPYTTLSSICHRKSDINECRVGTLRLIADALHVSPLDIINGSLVSPLKHNFIDDSVAIDLSDLPKMLKNSISELEDYDRENDPTFYSAADTMMLMADRFLAEGVIDARTYDLLARKYPIA